MAAAVWEGERGTDMRNDRQKLAKKLQWPMIITCLACIGVSVVSRITVDGWNAETPAWAKTVADIVIMGVLYVLGWSRGVFGESVWPVSIGKKK